MKTIIALILFTVCTVLYSLSLSTTSNTHYENVEIKNINSSGEISFSHKNGETILPIDKFNSDSRKIIMNSPVFFQNYKKSITLVTIDGKTYENVKINKIYSDKVNFTKVNFTHKYGESTLSIDRFNTDSITIIMDSPLLVQQAPAQVTTQVITAARLGGGDSAFDTKYGNPIASNEIDRYNITKKYYKNGYTISVLFKYYMAYMIQYEKEKESLTSEEVNYILDLNKESSEWEQVNFFKLSWDEKDQVKKQELIAYSFSHLKWMRKDGKAEAISDKNIKKLIILKSDFARELEKEKTSFLEGL